MAAVSERSGSLRAGRNDKLDANDWFSNFNGTGKAELRRNDWGYHVSGPILKDKLFFWWNQEWNREVRGQSVAACVPTLPSRAVISAQTSGAAPPTVANPAGTLATDQCGATQPAQWVGGVSSPLFQSLSKPPAILSRSPIQTRPVRWLRSSIPCRIPLSGTGHNWAQSENLVPHWSEWNVRGDYDATRRTVLLSATPMIPGPALGRMTPRSGESRNFRPYNSDWSQPSKSVMAELTSS